MFGVQFEPHTPGSGRRREDAGTAPKRKRGEGMDTEAVQSTLQAMRIQVYMSVSGCCAAHESAACDRIESYRRVRWSLSTLNVRECSRVFIFFGYARSLGEVEIESMLRFVHGQRIIETSFSHSYRVSGGRMRCDTYIKLAFALVKIRCRQDFHTPLSR